jgi:hypothetical protein
MQDRPDGKLNRIVEHGSSEQFDIATLPGHAVQVPMNRSRVVDQVSQSAPTHHAAYLVVAALAAEQRPAEFPPWTDERLMVGSVNSRTANLQAALEYLRLTCRQFGGHEGGVRLDGEVHVLRGHVANEEGQGFAVKITHHAEQAY